jgi:hypothetical protein
VTRHCAKIPLRTQIKDTKIGRGYDLGLQRFQARLVGHQQAQTAVQLGAVARVGVAEQAEQIFERLGDAST